MQQIQALLCKGCGSNELFEENGYLVCKYCGTRHLIADVDKQGKESSIDLNADIQRLLQRCREDPTRAKKLALRILEIDPTNTEAKRILGGPDNSKQRSGGCYIATAVYGSYDCPQVWTLRRFRDNSLAMNWYGRTFIHIYYAISPTLVKLFGDTTWFMNLCKHRLDKVVDHLNTKGVEDTPYHDKNW